MNSSDEQSIDSTIDISSIFFSIKRRWKIFLVVSVVVFSGNLLYTYYLWCFSKVYVGNFQLLISDPFSKSTGGGGMGPSAAMDNKFFEDLARNYTTTNIPTLIELLKSGSVLGDFSRIHGYNYSTIKSNINITPKGTSGGGGMMAMRGGGGQAGVLEISLSWHDPSEGNLILTQISELLLQFAQDEKQERLTKGLDFLNDQLPLLENNVTSIQDEIYNFRRENSLIEPISSGNSLKQNERKIRDEITQIEDSRRRLLQVRSEITAGTISANGYREAIRDGQSGASFNITESDQSLLKELTRVETELAASRSVYQPDSPIVVGLTDRLNAIKPLLLSNQLEAVDAALILLDGRLKNAQIRFTEAEANFLSTQALIRDYESLLERLEVARLKLNGIINARDSFNLDISQNATSWRVISNPFMGSIPISPNPSRNIIVGFISSLIFGSVSAYFFDIKQGVFYESNKVTSTLSLPLLVHIPYFPNFYHSLIFDPFVLPDGVPDIPADLIDLYRDTFLQFSQLFRKLYTSIQFINSDTPHKSFVFTSSIPGEGKTISVSNFAVTLSQLGFKVLLIDADLRKPQLHRHFNLHLKNGFSDMLENDTVDFQPYFNNIDNLSNLFIITAGASSTDPSILLNSDRFHTVFNYLSISCQFDYILFDSPPLLAFSDASLLSDYCSSTVFLVSLRNVKNHLPSQALKKLSPKASVLGVISNSIKPDLISSIDEPIYSSYYNSRIDKTQVNSNSSSSIPKHYFFTTLKSISSPLYSILRKFSRWFID